MGGQNRSKNGVLQNAYVPAVSLRKALRPLKGHRDKSGDDDNDYFAGGVATATAIVQTSLPRLMISRVSFGSMTQESSGFKTVSLPLTITVNSPASTR